MLQKSVFEGDIEAATRLDGEGTLRLWRNAGPTQDKGVLAAQVRGQSQQAFGLAQLVRFKANRDGRLGRLPVSWGGGDCLVCGEVGGIRLHERTFGERERSKRKSEKD